MPFYKRSEEEFFIAPTEVWTPEVTLEAATHAAHSYPVEGWYWFDNLDAALVFFAAQIETETYTNETSAVAASAM